MSCDWPSLSIVSSTDGKICIPNLTTSPIALKKAEHFGQLPEVFVPETVSFSATKYVKSVPRSSRATNHSTNISLDPDNILPNDICCEFELLLANYDSAFGPNFSGYNGKAGNFKAIVQPIQRKGHLPWYSRNKLVELQEHFNQLETLGVVKRPEEVGVVAEYSNPSFLVKKVFWQSLRCHCIW